MTNFETLANHGVVPVIVTDNSDDAVPLADALPDGSIAGD